MNIKVIIKRNIVTEKTISGKGYMNKNMNKPYNIKESSQSNSSTHQTGRKQEQFKGIQLNKQIGRNT